MSQPVLKQPAGGKLHGFQGNWQNTLFDSFKPCPKSAFACLCCPCYTAQLGKRAHEHILTILVNPCLLMELRTKVRTAYQIQGSLIEDCYTTTCCVCPCAAMQLDRELTHLGY